MALKKINDCFASLPIASMITLHPPFQYLFLSSIPNKNNEVFLGTCTNLHGCLPWLLGQSGNIREEPTQSKAGPP